MSKTNPTDPASKLTKREYFALEILKVELAKSGLEPSYIANFISEDCVHQADQLIRVLNGKQPILDKAVVYWPEDQTEKGE